MKVFRSFLWLVFALVPGCGFAGILLPSYSISVNKELIGVTNGCEIVDDMWEKTGEIVVISSFSGGGKRAAAFAFGVMLGLEQVTFELMNQKQSNLLDQLDLIAAVSGGAVPAVYYGVNKGSSEDWRHNFRSFLSEDTEFWLSFSSLYPANWFSASSVLAAKHFGALFNDRTFANLHKPPYLLIGATDISRGQEFIFSETQFRCIHSDLGQYPLGYAVAASAAFPVYFGSIPLKNFNTYGSPDEREYETLRGRVKGPIVPLLDGGLVDNLAVRAYLDPLANGMLIGGTSAPGRPPARALIFIQADGSAHLEEELDDTRRSPNIITRTRRSFDVTFEQQIRDIERELELALWKLDEVHALRRDFQFVYLPARLRDVKQETLRHVPTAWSLTEAQVNGLIEAGKQAITNESRKVGRIQNLFKTSSP